MSAYGLVKKTYKRAVPKRVRHMVYNIGPLRPMRNAAIRRLELNAEHDEIYDSDYYNEVVDPYMEKSARVMAGSVTRTFSPSSVVDIGCGTGLLLATLRKQGISDLKGFDYSTAALDICRSRNLDVEQLDLETDPIPPVKAEVVISTEVAEHLPESCANRYLDTLASVSDQIVMTAAQPADGSPAGQAVSGTDHVNEQPHSYWIDKLKTRGYEYDQEVTEEWRSEWSEADVEACYAENIMIFRRNA